MTAPNYRRADYVTERQRMVQGPLADPLPVLRPLWQDLAAAAFLVLLIAACIFP